MTTASPTNDENKNVIPAQAGIQEKPKTLDSCFYRNDKLPVNSSTFYFQRNSHFFNRERYPVTGKGGDS